jgi:hypothetical protein
MVFSTASAFAQAADPYVNWRPPYRVIYGGYSMEPDDWALWAGVFNLVHHALLGREPAETRQLLDAARKHQMKILTVVGLWDAATDRMDDSKLKKLLADIGHDEPALFGYQFEAAYRIPPERQKDIYDAIKKVDPLRPVWMEFSSTSPETWKRFNPQACDAVLSYNYPYEVTDKSDDTMGRVSYSVRAIQAVKPKDLPVVPLLQAFSGQRWRPIPRGGMAAQFERWLDVGPVAGVGFYRWRGRQPYAGVPDDGTQDGFGWQESQELCRQLAPQPGPFVSPDLWRKTAGRDGR